MKAAVLANDDHTVGMVVAEELLRPEDGSVDVALGREVDHSRDPVLGERLFDERLVADVALHELDSVPVDQVRDVGEISRVGQSVEDDNAVARFPATRAQEVGADEPRAAGDEHLLHLRDLIATSGPLNCPVDGLIRFAPTPR